MITYPEHKSTKPRPKPTAHGFQNLSLSREPSKAVFTARLGLAFGGSALPAYGFKPCREHH
jgi:hypothetical protein